jgi:hypothetical protein
MKYQINIKRLLFFFSLAVLLSFGAGTASAQRRGQVRSANWQTSVPPGISRGSVTLGIRDKFATMGRYNGLFTVTGPGGRSFQARASGSGDEWTYVNFPGDFNGGGSANGVYSVVFSVNGVTIARGSFRFRP